MGRDVLDLMGRQCSSSDEHAAPVQDTCMSGSTASPLTCLIRPVATTLVLESVAPRCCPVASNGLCTQVQGQGLGIIIWALAKICYDPIRIRFLLQAFAQEAIDRLTDGVPKNEPNLKLGPQSLSNMVYAYAVMGYHPGEDLLTAIAQGAHAQLTNFSPQVCHPARFLGCTQCDSFWQDMWIKIRVHKTSGGAHTVTSFGVIRVYNRSMSLHTRGTSFKDACMAAQTH